MQAFLPQQLKRNLSGISKNQLALMAAVLFEVLTRQFLLQNQQSIQFLTMWVQLMFETSPLLLAHYFAFRNKDWNATFIWLSGFVLYPLVCLVLASYEPLYSQWTLFELQSWIYLLVASAGFGLSHLLAKKNHSRYSQFVTRLFSLNSVLLLLTLVWAILWAGIFASHDDPVRNQPLKAAINSETVIVNFGFFLNYLWQFIIMGAAVLLIYWVNRYLLIRRILASSGVFAYTAGCIICIILLTPALASIVLWLPMNIPEWTFLPSEDHNLFAPINFRFCFLILAVSTPMILAFERQQNDKALAEIAQRQSQIELQLLQQQINPHFLFNTLNNLYALTLTGSKDAPTLVMQLANLLRYTVYEGQNHRVVLAQEIQYIQDFLALQSIRSGDKCRLSVSYPEHANRWEIAPLLLIIIIENAFKHGVETSQSHCEVDINIQIEGSCLLMSCKNSLPAINKNRQPGIGLDNLKRRLALLYSGKYSLSSSVQNSQWQTKLSLELESCSAP